MHIQKSFRGVPVENVAGVLYLVATPIGNLEDITLRALRTLREVDLIAAEDTRHTRKLLSFYEIPSKLKSYHEHNKHESGRQIVEIMVSGKSVALVSDAGMPAISDPGFDLVCLAVEQGVRVVPIPGANAALSALVVSGLSTDAFTFIGFLPRDKKGARAALQKWRTHEQTLLLYESPHRITQTLRLLLEEWGNRLLTVARELTKKHEELWRGTVSECLEHIQEQGAQGEFCLVVEGAPLQPETISNHLQPVDLCHEVDALIVAGIDEKEAIKQVAKTRGVPKRVVYNEFVQKKNL